MNWLSVLIYFASVSESMKEVAAFVAIVGVFVSMGLIAGMFIARSESQGRWHSLEEKADYREWSEIFGRYAKRASVTLVIAGLIAIFTPTATTLYLIAGSEAGEAVATSADGQEMYSKVKDLINEKLEEMGND